MRVYLKGVAVGVAVLLVLLLVHTHLHSRHGTLAGPRKGRARPGRGGAAGAGGGARGAGGAGGARGGRQGAGGGAHASRAQTPGSGKKPKGRPAEGGSAPPERSEQRFGFQPWRGRPRPPVKITNESETWLKDMRYPKWYTDAVKRSKVYRLDNMAGSGHLYDDPCPNAAEVKAKYKKEGTETFSYIIPGDFIPESKNPCWYPEDGSQMLCVPYFYVAGVAKCGTTDLFKRVRFHPDIMEGELKEYHWWDRLRYGAPMELKFTNDSEKNESPLPLEEYSRIITGKEIVDLQNDLQDKGYSDRICGDGSPSYLWEPTQWTIFEGNEGCTEPKIVSGSFIHRANPESKFFLLFRHPTPRLYSRFLSRIPRYPPFKNATPQMFHDYVVKGVNCYKKCFREHSIRECAYNETLYDEAVIRIIEGMYSVFMEDWLRIFRRDQMMIIRNEDYSDDIEGHILDAFNFLEVSSLRKTQMRPILTHVSTNIGQNYDVVGPMLPETIEILNEFYKPFVLRLYELLEDERFLWKDIVIS
ncbi:carbohydrate sulfotransferase 15-like [Babylonia areolata]|uniref:carbohydrate sulfotransferase 15-like n=1 Tax=Babylonia areolata TaxID=304850 RepID=UPI003FD53332